MTSRRSLLARAVAAYVLGAAVLAVLCLVVFAVPVAIVSEGVIAGLVVALPAVALLLVYRVNRIINFAQLAIGAAGGQLTLLLLRFEPAVPFWASLTLGLGLSAAVGAIVELVIGRRFARAPRVALTIITIAVAYAVGNTGSSLIQDLPFLPPKSARPITAFAGPGGLQPYLPLPHLAVHIGSFAAPLGFSVLFPFEVSIVLLGGLFVFLRYSRMGTAIRAVAENTERAALLGVSVGLLSTVVWTIGGVLSGASVTFNAFIGDPRSSFGFVPEALLLPLVAVTIGRFRSFGATIAGAIACEVLSASVDYSHSSYVDLLNVGFFVVVAVGAYLARPPSYRQTSAEVSWAATRELRPIPEELARIGGIRAARWTLIGLVVVAAVVLPIVGDTTVMTTAQTGLLDAIVALSLVVLTGWAGQVSLGQFALVGIGAAITGGLAAHLGLPFLIVVPMATVATALVAMLIGYPALRVPGLLLAGATFALAVAVETVLFDHRWFGWLLPRSGIRRPTVLLVNFDDERAMYALCLVALIASAAVVINLRRSRAGRILIGARDNEANLASIGFNVVRARLLGFAVSGGLAGLAGSLFAYQLRDVPQIFDANASVTIAVVTVLGGITSVLGALLAGVYMGVTGRINSNVIADYILPLLPLGILYAVPGGLASIVVGVRDSVLRVIAQRRQLVVPSLFADYDPDTVARRLVPLRPPSSDSGLRALGDVDFALPSRRDRTGVPTP